MLHHCEGVGDEGCASVCTALEQNKTLTSFTLLGMLCSGVCSVQVIGVLWCKCSGAVITSRSFSGLPVGPGHYGLHYGILHCECPCLGAEDRHLSAQNGWIVPEEIKEDVV